MPAVTSWASLCYFAPFLVIVLYKRPFRQTLAWAVGCGLIMDVLSGYPNLGIHAIAYCGGVAVLKTQKQNFFDYYASTIPVFTYLFASSSTLFLMLLYRFFGSPLEMSGYWILTDLLIYPAFDALYAYLIYTLPGLFMPTSPKHEYFL